MLDDSSLRRSLDLELLEMSGQDESSGRYPSRFVDRLDDNLGTDSLVVACWFA
jgi:hypothetical protein